MSADTVIFRKWRKSFDPDQAVFALFPKIPADLNGVYCTSYQHVGQHGAADYNHCIRSSFPVKPEEYSDLATELRQIGYDLNIRQRNSPR
jgi:hypothetical protein